LANGRRVHRSNKKAMPASTSNYKFSYSKPTRSSDSVKSLETNACSTAKIERQKYTGTLVKGISTMHKSNAVPIINEEQARDHANMRR
jgi:hypothetical protein